MMNSMQSPVAPRFANQRKRELLERIEATLDEIESWRKYNAAYHEDDRNFMRFLIPRGKRVLELGCGRGDLLARLEPSHGVGVDFSPGTIARARALYPGFWATQRTPRRLPRSRAPFDYIVLADTNTICLLEDIDGTLRLIHQLCSASTRIIIAYYSHLWEPILKTAEALRLRNRQPRPTTSPPPIFSI
jgi:SAM-dependent methyltransferase